MSKNIQKITRADGVTQGYHVGSDASPATRPDGSPHSSPVTEEEVADRVQRGRAHAWTVIATDPNTGQVIADEVEAPDEWAAFQVAIEQRSESDSLDYVAAIPGAHDVYTPTESGTTAAGIDYPTGDDDDTPIWDDTTPDYVTASGQEAPGLSRGEE